MDLRSARSAGIDFFTHKATEATGTHHVHYGEALRRARDAGVPVLGAYHVVRSPRNARAEVDFFLSYLDSQTPWWRTWPHFFLQVDLEKWPYDSVPAGEGEDFADIAQALTGKLAVIYASKGQYGDSLAGTSHDLWNANYGSNPAVDFRTAYPGNDSPRWAAYSGRVPKLLQYGSNTTIGRQHGCDANAFRGTVEDLKRWISPTEGTDDDMSSERLEWWADATEFGRDQVAGGPVAGRKMWIVEAIKDTRAKVAALSDAAAAEVVRDAANAKTIDALASALRAGGGNVETAAILAGIDQAVANATGPLKTIIADLRRDLMEAEAAKAAGGTAAAEALKGERK
jgi:GH25 family lysozyme M1 (1,4-beta-N-acetylmuramidase)